MRVDIVRWWRPRATQLVDVHDVAWLEVVGRGLPPLSPAIAACLGDLERALAENDGLSDETSALVGLGPGLTPEGDDLLTGLLVALRSLRGAEALTRRLSDAIVAQAPTRTTEISAALLRCAASGYAIPRLLEFVEALGSPPSSGELVSALNRLLAVGHTSGVALAHGVLCACRWHAHSSARPEVA
jgi:hypothetical protein